MELMASLTETSAACVLHRHPSDGFGRTARRDRIG